MLSDRERAEKLALLWDQSPCLGDSASDRAALVDMITADLGTVRAEALEQAAARFRESFYVRHDHTYSGRDVYEWLRALKGDA